MTMNLRCGEEVATVAGWEGAARYRRLDITHRSVMSISTLGSHGNNAGGGEMFHREPFVASNWYLQAFINSVRVHFRCMHQIANFIAFWMKKTGMFLPNPAPPATVENLANTQVLSPGR